MKKFVRYIAVSAAAVMLILLMAGCGTKTLVCDHCGQEYKVAKSSNVEQDWINYCPDCAEELGLNDLNEAD